MRSLPTHIFLRIPSITYLLVLLISGSLGYFFVFVFAHERAGCIVELLMVSFGTASHTCFVVVPSLWMSLSLPKSTVCLRRHWRIGVLVVVGYQVYNHTRIKHQASIESQFVCWRFKCDAL